MSNKQRKGEKNMKFKSFQLFPHPLIYLEDPENIMYYTYILASKRNGTLYIGTTRDLEN